MTYPDQPADRLISYLFSNPFLNGVYKKLPLAPANTTVGDNRKVFLRIAPDAGFAVLLTVQLFSLTFDN
jgi:hypothetical protein